MRKGWKALTTLAGRVLVDVTSGSLRDRQEQALEICVAANLLNSEGMTGAPRCFIRNGAARDDVVVVVVVVDIETGI